MSKITFDLDDLDTVGPSEEGRWLNIKKPGSSENSTDHEGKPRRILLLGPDSSTYQKAMIDTVNRRISEDAPVAEQQEHAITNSIEVMAACSMKWEGFYDTEKQPISCNADNARALYRAYPAIRGQIDAFITNRRNFTRASPKG